VLADVAANNLAMLGAAVGQDILDEIVSELVTSNCIKVSMNMLQDVNSSYCQ